MSDFSPLSLKMTLWLFGRVGHLLDSGKPLLGRIGRHPGYRRMTFAVLIILEPTSDAFWWSMHHRQTNCRIAHSIYQGCSERNMCVQWNRTSNWASCLPSLLCCIFCWRCIIRTHPVSAILLPRQVARDLLSRTTLMRHWNVSVMRDRDYDSRYQIYR